MSSADAEGNVVQASRNVINNNGANNSGTGSGSQNYGKGAGSNRVSGGTWTGSGGHGSLINVGPGAGGLNSGAASASVNTFSGTAFSSEDKSSGAKENEVEGKRFLNGRGAKPTSSKTKNSHGEQMVGGLERQREQFRRRANRAKGGSSQQTGSVLARERQSCFDQSPARPTSSHGGTGSLAQQNRAVHDVASSDLRKWTREEGVTEEHVPLEQKLERMTTSGDSSSAAIIATTAGGGSGSRTAPIDFSQVQWGAPLIKYQEGFSYLAKECYKPIIRGMLDFIPPEDRERGKNFMQQHGMDCVMIKMMDALNYVVALYEHEQTVQQQGSKVVDTCKQLIAEKNSFLEEVNHLQSFEMANRAAMAKSKVDELTKQVAELKEELEMVLAEKESAVLAARHDAELRATSALEDSKRTREEKDQVLLELGVLKTKMVEAQQMVAKAQANLQRVEGNFRNYISKARAQGVEWFIQLDTFKEAASIATMNNMIEIYNEVRGKVLRHQPDFPISELAFVEGEEIDEQGKNLAPQFDTSILLKWSVDEEGAPLFPPSILEEGEEPGLSYADWVATMPQLDVGANVEAGLFYP